MRVVVSIHAPARGATVWIGNHVCIVVSRVHIETLMVWRWFFFGKKEENGENIEVVSIAMLPGSLCSIGARTHYTISTPSGS